MNSELPYPLSFPKHNGWLVIQAFTSRRVYPVSGATVLVTQSSPKGTIELSREITDISGMTSPIALPGIARNQTLAPEADYSSIADRYSYDITVTHPDYVTMIFHQVPIYEGITSIQGVEFIPKSASSNPDMPIHVNERQTAI